MPRKKIGKKVEINIQRISAQRLLDPKLRGLKKSRFPATTAIIAGVGLFVIAGAFGYFYFYKNNSLTTDYAPEIIVPEPTLGEAAAEPEQAAPLEPAVTVQKVKILDTPTGYLNVREGPGTNFQKIAQVTPGESYELISSDEPKGWYKIKLDETRSGWVTKQYAEVQK